MSLSFPTSPTNGQTYQNWVWSSSVNAWLPNFANQFVTSFNGRAGPVTMLPADNTTGNRVLILTQTLSAPSASINFPGAFTGAFVDYELDISNLQFSTTQYVGVQLGTNGTWDGSASYNSMFYYMSVQAVFGPPGSGWGVQPYAAQSAMVITANVTGTDTLAAARYNGTVKLRGMGLGTGSYKYIYGQGVHHHPTLSSTFETFGCNGGNVAYTDVRVVPNSVGNYITAGTFSLYGIKP